MEALATVHEQMRHKRPQAKAPEGLDRLFRKPYRERGPAVPILCVDDHDSCSTLFDILSDLGYHVDVAYNTSEALIFLGLHNYALGVFAFGEPEVDGAELCKQMNEARGKHACVMLTEGMLAADIVDAVERLGDSCLLVKPIDIARLLAFIDNSTCVPNTVFLTNRDVRRRSCVL